MRKYTFLIAMLVAVFVLAACGSNSEDESLSTDGASQMEEGALVESQEEEVEVEEEQEVEAEAEESTSAEDESEAEANAEEATEELAEEEADAEAVEEEAESEEPTEAQDESEADTAEEPAAEDHSDGDEDAMEVKSAEAHDAEETAMPQPTSEPVEPIDWYGFSAEHAVCMNGLDQNIADMKVVTATDLETIVFDYGGSTIDIIRDSSAIQIRHEDGNGVEVNGEIFALIEMEYLTPNENVPTGSFYAREFFRLIYEDTNENLAVACVFDYAYGQ